MISSVRRLAGCMPLAVVLCVFCLILLAFYLVLSFRLPEDAPLARMYRTEADIAFLKKAVENYYKIKGSYPRAGQEGLNEAARLLSANANYLPGGAPPDAWGHEYCYVPHESYGDPQWHALSVNGVYCEGGTYQVYSAGMDGDPGVEDLSKRADNITAWDESKSWRPVYRAANKSFLRNRKARL